VDYVTKDDNEIFFYWDGLWCLCCDLTLTTTAHDRI
jgi:hypothetical protein